MATKAQLIKKHEQVIDAASKLQDRLEELSKLATEFYGEELMADLCAGSEIEFRTTDHPDGLDGIALRLEDIIEKK